MSSANETDHVTLSEVTSAEPFSVVCSAQRSPGRQEDSWLWPVSK